MRQVVLSVMMLAAAAASSPALGRQPLRENCSMTQEDAKFVAELLIERSTVIADGVIVQSKKPLLSRDKREVLWRLPRLRPIRVIKGPSRPYYVLTEDEDGAPSRLHDLPTGTKVRLLMELLRSSEESSIWEVKSTAYCGTVASERVVNAKVDMLLESRRLSDTSLVLEVPPPAAP
jgi:hypothetical protein